MSSLFRAPDPKEPLLQGDVWDGLPFLLARELPLIVVRYLQHGMGGRSIYHGYRLGQEPQPTREPIHLDSGSGGDKVIALGFQSQGIVLTHDCEIENAPDHITVAPIMPWSNLAPEHQQEAADGKRRDVFPLLAQSSPPFDKSYVKFARISVIHRDVLKGCTRIVSGTDDLTKRLTVAFFHYLLHPEDS